MHRKRMPIEHIMQISKHVSNFLKGPTMIFQLHWQNPKNTSETFFVSQFDANCHDGTVDEWAKLKIVEHQDTKPSGWVPMVCNQDSEHFVFSKASASKLR